MKTAKSLASTLLLGSHRVTEEPCIALARPEGERIIKVHQVVVPSLSSAVLIPVASTD